MQIYLIKFNFLYFCSLGEQVVNIGFEQISISLLSNKIQLLILTIQIIWTLTAYCKIKERVRDLKKGIGHTNNSSCKEKSITQDFLLAIPLIYDYIIAYVSMKIIWNEKTYEFDKFKVEIIEDSQGVQSFDSCNN